MRCTHTPVLFELDELDHITSACVQFALKQQYVFVLG